MFGFTGLRLKHVQALKREYSIYLLDNGRCVAPQLGASLSPREGQAFALALTFLPLHHPTPQHLPLGLQRPERGLRGPGFRHHPRAGHPQPAGPGHGPARVHRRGGEERRRVAHGADPAAAAAPGAAVRARERATSSTEDGHTLFGTACNFWRVARLLMGRGPAGSHTHTHKRQQAARASVWLNLRVFWDCERMRMGVSALYF